MTRYRHCWFLSLSFLFLFSSVALAGVSQGLIVNQVREDFSVIEGYILMPLDGEYLVDLGEQSGIRVGDLLSVSRPGARVIHPVSGEDLGTVEERISLLEVTSLRPKYSHARVLTGEKELSRGEKVKRFAGMKATFEGTGSVAEGLYSELRNALPTLTWQKTDQGRNVSADLHFILAADHLVVRTDDAVQLGRYEVTGLSESQPVSLSHDSVPSSAETVDSAIPQSSAALVEYPSGGRRVSVEATLPGEVVMADFVQSQNGLLLAVTDGSSVHVYRISDHLEPLAERRITNRRIHSLSWWQPSVDELFLVVSGSEENGVGQGTAALTVPQSNLFRLKDERLDPAYQDLAYFLGTFDLDGDTRRESLVGQPFDLDNDYGQVVRFQTESGQLKPAPLDVTLPYPFPVQGSIFAHLSNSQQPEAVRLKGGVLTVYHGKRKVFQSRKGYGGSISQLRYDRNPDQAATLFGMLVFEVNPVVVDIDGDGQKELIAVSSKHSGFQSSFGGRVDVSNVGLAVLKYDEGKYVQGNVKVESDAPIQGLYADSDRILFVSSGLEDPAGKGKISHLMSLSLADTQ